VCVNISVHRNRIFYTVEKEVRFLAEYQLLATVVYKSVPDVTN